MTAYYPCEDIGFDEVNMSQGTTKLRALCRKGSMILSFDFMIEPLVASGRRRVAVAAAQDEDVLLSITRLRDAGSLIRYSSATRQDP